MNYTEVQCPFQIFASRFILKKKKNNDAVLLPASKRCLGRYCGRERQQKAYEKQNKTMWPVLPNTHTHKGNMASNEIG